ncbi:MAG: Holliday junction branch migration protein RuvA, partial [Actinomycetota bacterium]
GDHAFLERLPGIGKKVASRIVLELREKMDLPSGARGKDWRSDLKQGLVNLGYGEREAEGAIREIGEQSDLSSALKAALSHLTAIRR